MFSYLCDHVPGYQNDVLETKLGIPFLACQISYLKCHLLELTLFQQVKFLMMTWQNKFLLWISQQVNHLFQLLMQARRNHFYFSLQTDHSHRKNLVGHRVVSVSWAMVRCISAPTLHLIHGKGNNTGHKTLLQYHPILRWGYGSPY